jgi:predicted HNH restriction endonuclease
MLGEYVLKKEVDKSLLTEGFNIPIEFQVVFKRNIGKFLKRGESKDIVLYLNGKSYKAQIKNQKFDDTKYNNHNDIVQVRYNRNSEIVQEFRTIFNYSYKYIDDQRLQKKLLDDYKMGKIYINIPEEFKEYLIIYTTEYEDTYILDTITTSDMFNIKEFTQEQPERIYEESFNYNVIDESATIVLDKRMVKLRKYNNSIGKNIKELYEYRCQVCGQRVGEAYNSNVVEAHHIDSFVKSLNNNMSNIMIVCPNHHSIIHDVNPYFNKKSKMMIYKNGHIEGLQINYHL